MQVFRLFIGSLALFVLITACATGPGQERGTVHCPACEAEFDALFEQRF